MSNKEYVICDKTDLVAVADAIRGKTGSTDDLTVGGLTSAVSGIESGGSGGVTVSELITVTFETIGNEEWGGSTTLYPINIGYLTIDENNTLCRKTVSGLSGSISFVPNAWLDLWTDEVEQDDGWGGTSVRYPNILKLNNEYLYVSTNGSDSSMCAYNTYLLNNSDHITIQIS